MLVKSSLIHRKLKKRQGGFFFAIAVIAEGAADVGAGAAVAGAGAVAADGVAAGGLDAGLTGAFDVAGSEGAGLGISNGIWADAGGSAFANGATGAFDMGGSTGTGLPGSGGIVGSASPNFLTQLMNNKNLMTLGGDALKGIGGSVNSAQNRQTAMDIANLNAQAPTNQYLAKRAAVSSSIPSGPLPFQPNKGAVLTRPDGTPVYVKGTGIVAQQGVQ